MNCFKAFSIDSIKCNTFFSAMFKYLNTVHKDDFIQPFKPVICVLDDIFVTFISLPTQ